MSRETSIKAPTENCERVVSVSTSAAQSAAFEGGTYIYVSDQASYLLYGENPTATTSSQFIPANTLLRIAGVVPGHKASVLATGSGTAWFMREV